MPESVSGAGGRRLSLPRSAVAVPIARALVRTALADACEREPAGSGRAVADRDTAELLTAELVANAVEHARPGGRVADDDAGGIELIVELVAGPDGWGCLVEVHDGDARVPGGLLAPEPELGPASEMGTGTGPVPDHAPGHVSDTDPDLACPLDLWREDGRGLLLLRALSSSCGHRATERGKAVWFRLSARPTP
ncbi:ATP-binding protein [Streptomyces sp. BI20]|uniref:ATP-binding protein n=1 Tax=Streptomyces sp. BI20 TaxID=3403460 RepID=UPI003C78D326